MCFLCAYYILIKILPSIQLTETDKSQLVIKQQVGFLHPARMFFEKLATNFIHTNICLIVHVNES